MREHLARQLEIFTKRKLRFMDTKENQADVILQDESDGKGPYIKEWNIKDIEQPDIDKLPEYSKTEYETLFGVEKSDKEKIVDLENELVVTKKELKEFKESKESKKIK